MKMDMVFLNILFCIWLCKIRDKFIAFNRILMRSLIIHP